MTVPAERPVEHYWDDLVNRALLGTDRRSPPAPPAGPFAELALERPGADPAAALVDQVAAVAVVRRAAFRPTPRLVGFDPPPVDPRPECPAAAIHLYAELLATFPIVEDEWLLAVLGGGWRTAREMVVPLLLRHRGDAVRRRRVELAAGPLAAWLVEHLGPSYPGLALPRRKAVDPAAVDLEARSLPILPVPPDLARLLTVPHHELFDDLMSTVVIPLHHGGFGPAYRDVLVNLVARLPRHVLDPLTVELGHAAGGSPALTLAETLADLAHLRHRLFSILLPDTPESP